MKEFHGGFTTSSNDWENKRNKPGKQSKSEECQCSSSSVKIHHFDCPLVKKKSCPLHRENLRGKSDTKMVMLVQSDLQNNMYYPIQTVVTCNRSTKPKVCSFCSGISHPGSKESARTRQPQTNVDEFKRTRYYFDDNYICESKVLVDEKSNKIRKLKKCFHSPCESITPTSARDKDVADDYGRRKGTKDVSVLVKTISTDGGEEIKENIKHHIKSTSEDDYYQFGITQMHELGKNTGVHLSPYLIYPTRATGTSIKGDDRTRYKFQGEELIATEDKTLHGHEPEVDEEEDVKEYITDSEVVHSESSGSVFFTPFILVPNDYSKESRDPPPVKQSQIKEKDLTPDDYQKHNLCQAKCSQTSSKKNKGTNVAVPLVPKQLENTTVEPKTKEAFTQVESSLISDSNYSYVSEYATSQQESHETSKSSKASTPNMKEPKTKSQTAQVTESLGEVFKDEITYEEIEKNTLTVTDTKSRRSVKVQTVGSETVEPLFEKVVLENSWEKYSWNTKEVSVEPNKHISKPSTSYKMIETSVSITTKVPKDVECCCSEMPSDVNNARVNPSSPTNDTYVLKPFQRLDTSATVDREIKRWLNKCNSDSNLYKGSGRSKLVSEQVSKHSSEESEFYPCSCRHFKSTVKSVGVSNISAQMQTTSSAVKTRKQEDTPVSDLSEIIRMIDQRFDRMTNEMKGICDCDRPQIIQKEVVVRVEREVMTDAIDLHDDLGGQSCQKKEIHFVNSKITSTVSEADATPKGTSPSRIRQAIPLGDSGNGAEVWICKICANMIKTFTTEKSTNTDIEKAKQTTVQAIEYENSRMKTILKKEDAASPPSTTASKKPPGSSIPVPNKHHCADIVPPGTVKLTPPGKTPPQQTNYTSAGPTKPIPSPQQNYDLDESPSTSSRKRRRTFDKLNVADIVKASGKEQLKPLANMVSNMPTTFKQQQPVSNKSTPRPQNVSQPQNRTVSKTPSPTKPRVQKKPPNNLTFPVIVPSLRFNEYIRVLQNEAIKHSKAKSAVNSHRKNVEEDENSVENNKMADPSENARYDASEYFFLRAAKSDSFSCHYDHSVDHTFLKRGKDHPWLPLTVGPVSPRETGGYFCEKAVKSEELLKRVKPDRNMSSFMESERSENIIGDNFRPEQNCHHELTDLREKCKCFFCKCWTYFSSVENEQLLPSEDTILCQNPLSYDGESSQQDFSEDEQFYQEDDTNVEGDLEQ
ncbi:hypothetical protein RUM43_007069 [Polyplax serrata]|uniref:Uncharacterized protein n=1 Tax=Polyplax serrata TaxID=468196 RepID=A0AAN8P510_POLSC